MTPEEFQRLKEEEKAHLRKMKELKELARGLRRQQSVDKALSEIGSIPEKLNDTYNEIMERLGMAHATNEARLDMALEEEAERARQREFEAASEEDLQKIRAQQVLEQMKSESAQPRPEAKPAEEKKKEPTQESEKLPEKTIGRMRQ